MGKRELDPMGAFFALALTRASVTPKSSAEALYAQLRRDMDNTFTGSSEQYQQDVRKRARICKV